MDKVYLCEVLRSKKNKYWNRIKSAGNYKILWHSEQYNTKQKALNPVKKFAKHVGVRKCAIKYIDQVNKTSEVI
jgi:uncharacterized protein YegP (UPF0339 family)